MVWPTMSSGSRLIRLMALAPSRRKPSSPSTVSRSSALRTSSMPKFRSNRRMNGPIAALALLSLALPRSSAERPSTSRRLTSLPSVAPTMLPGARHDEHDLRLGIVPRRHRVEAGLRQVADRRHGLRLGEHLGVGADADLQILRPHAPPDQKLLQRHGLLRARLQPAQVVADRALDLGADRVGALGAAARLLLDDPLQHGDDEGDAGRLHRLQVDRREQPRFRGVAALARRVGEDFGERADVGALGGRGGAGGVVAFAEVAHGGGAAPRCRPPCRRARRRRTGRRSAGFHTRPTSTARSLSSGSGSIARSANLMKKLRFVLRNETFAP